MQNDLPPLPVEDTSSQTLVPPTPQDIQKQEETALKEKLLELRLPHFLPQIPTILSLLLIAAAIPTTFYLTQHPQDNRQFAAPPTPTPSVQRLLTIEELTKHLNTNSKSPNFSPLYDLDHNGSIDNNDLLIFNARFCSTTGAETLVPQNYPTQKTITDHIGKPYDAFFDIDNNGTVDKTDVAVFLQQACTKISITPNKLNPAY